MDSDLVLLSHEIINDHFKFCTGKERGVFELSIPLVGAHNIANALQCLSCLFLLKKGGGSRIA